MLVINKDWFCSWLQPIMVGGYDGNTGIMVDRKESRKEGSPGQDTKHRV